MSQKLQNCSSSWDKLIYYLLVYSFIHNENFFYFIFFVDIDDKVCSSKKITMTFIIHF